MVTLKALRKARGHFVVLQIKDHVIGGADIDPVFIEVNGWLSVVDEEEGVVQLLHWVSSENRDDDEGSLILIPAIVRLRVLGE